MPEVFVGVGSNVDRDHNIEVGLVALREAFGDLRCSSVIDNPAVGFAGDDFLNLVVAFDTALDPYAVAERLSAIEESFGRVKSKDAGVVSRTLDLDLLLYGDLESDELRVPRAEILEYAFVLGPLAELAPDARHPVDGRTYMEMWRDSALRSSRSSGRRPRR